MNKRKILSGSNFGIDVFLNKTKVGRISYLGMEKTIFTFDGSYIENESRPTLSQSFLNTSGALITLTEPLDRRLHPFFSNLLPEGHLRTYLSEQLQINPKREFLMLGALGDDLPGAVRLEVSADLANVLDTEIEHDAHDADGADMRFSLAGVQMKFSAIMDTSGGLTIPARGVGGHWILKLPSSRFDSVPEMEYSMLKFARLIGIDVPEFKLIPTASIRNLPEGVGNIYGETLAVKRFDRADGGQRVHMEDFAQVFELYPEQKYKQLSYGAIGSALYTVTGEKGLVEYISRLVFNIAIGNSDMHAKNWSLLYSDPRKPTLSPAYDLVATIAYTKKNVELAFHIGNEKRLSRISMEHFSKMAQKALLPERMVKRIVKDTSELIVEGWNKEKTNLGIPGEGLNVIEQNMMNSELFHRYFRKTS